MGETPKKSFRLSAYDKAVLSALGEKLGLGEVHVIRLALRRLAEAEGIEVPVKGQGS